MPSDSERPGRHKRPEYGVWPAEVMALTRQLELLEAEGAA
jgi:hypothetical protein